MASLSSIHIRPARRDDYAAWLPLWTGYNSFYGRSGRAALADDITTTTWSRFFDTAEPVHALVAEADGELIGLAHYLFHRSTTAIAPSCYLQDLFTAEGARGKGAGRALIEAVAAEVRRAGTLRLYWHTHQTNSTAMALYDTLAAKSGFLVYSKVLA